MGTLRLVAWMHAGADVNEDNRTCVCVGHDGLLPFAQAVFAAPLQNNGTEELRDQLLRLVHHAHHNESDV
jgi:hypothetical protein